MFRPHFCPNPECHFHAYQNNQRSVKWYSKDGFYSSRLYGKVQRYKCKYCKVRFSEQTFNIDYHVKKKVSYKAIFNGIAATSSISDLSRKEKVSPHTIINRERRLAAQAMYIHSILLSTITIQEPIVCDGFQSVVQNFYFPNNINIAIGKRTQFFYSLSYAQIKRAGNLSDQQVEKKEHYESVSNIDPKAVEKSFSELISSIIEIMKESDKSELTLFTDRKQAYVAAIRNNLKLRTLIEAEKFQHTRISSKEPRTIKNPLFSVNYMDRQFRKDLSEHVVKSICFGRNVNNQLERMVIYRFYHNFIKSYRVRGNNKYTHSDMAGIPSKLSSYYIKHFFRERFFPSRIKILSVDQKILKRIYPTPLLDNSNLKKQETSKKDTKIA